MTPKERATFTDQEILQNFRNLQKGAISDLDLFWKKVAKAGTPLVEELDSKSSRVIFLYRNQNPKTENVIITQYGLASFDRREWGMTKQPGTDVWYLEKILPVGTRLVYAIQENTPMIYMADARRIEDISWADLISHCVSDPLNHSPYLMPGKFAFGEKDVAMSVFYHPAAVAPQYSTKRGSQKGTLIQQTLPSQFLPEKLRELFIYIPEGYQDRDYENQRLLVVFDGDAYVQLVSAPIILDNLIEQGLIPKTIAVFVRNPHPNTETRIRDLIAGKEFYQFIADEMMPWIQEHYAFNPKHTIVSGSSAGGWAAAYSVLNYPALFPKALCQSPAMAWPVEDEDNWLLNKYVQADLTGREFFIDVGTLENAQWQNHGLSLAQSARVLRDIIRAKKIPVHFVEFSGGHDYISWEITFAEGLQYLIGQSSHRAYAIEDNFRECMLHLAQLGSFEVKNEGVTFIKSRVAAPNMNLVTGLDLNANSEIIAATIQEFQSERIPFIWIKGPSNKDLVIESDLKRGGLSFLCDATLLECSLDGPMTQPKLEGLEIVRVENQDLLQQWTAVSDQSFFVGMSSVSDLFFKKMSPLIFADQHLHLYLALMNGVSVGCSMLYLGKKSAGIYWGGVVPNAQKKGIGTAMMQYRMKVAKDAGYENMVVQCFETSLKNAKRLGFQEYGKMDLYGWTPESAVHR